MYLYVRMLLIIHAIIVLLISLIVTNAQEIRQNVFIVKVITKLKKENVNYVKKDLLYINAHGTGTPLNDKSETVAIKLALGEDAARKAMISSTKSMTGHMLGATGAVELIASALTLKNGVVTPTIRTRLARLM